MEGKEKLRRLIADKEGLIVTLAKELGECKPEHARFGFRLQQIVILAEERIELLRRRRRE